MDSEIANEKNKDGKLNIKKYICIGAIVLAAVVVACGVVLGSVFGVACSSAKKNTTVSRTEAVEISKAYVESTYGAGNMRVEEVDRDMIMSAGLSKSYYKYEVELIKDATMKIEIEIDGRTGDIIFAEVDR